MAFGAVVLGILLLLLIAIFGWFILKVVLVVAIGLVVLTFAAVLLLFIILVGVSLARLL
jgi:hypothetical protein